MSNDRSVGTRTLLAGALVAACGIAVYSNALHGPFIFDDIFSIEESPNVRSLTPLSEALSAPPGSGASGRPLVALSLAANHALGGFEVFGYHLFNVAVHVLTALLLLGVVRRGIALRAASAERPSRAPPALPIALAASLLWVVHPLASDAINQVISRNEAMMALFYLATLYCALRGFASERSRIWPVLTVVASFMGMACKEDMASAPLLVLLFDRTFVSRSFGSALGRRPRLYLGLGLSLAFVAGLALAGDRGVSIGFDQKVTPLAYLASQAHVLAMYLKLSFWPNPLVLDYGDWSAFRGPGGFGVTALAIFALLALCIWGVARRRVAGFLGIACFAVLAPTSSVLPITGEVAAEHRMYLPLAALAVLVVLAVWRLLEAPSLSIGVARTGARARTPLAIGLLAATTGTLGWMTVRRNTDYASAISIWADTVSKRPQNHRAHYSLADQYDRAGQAAMAERSYRNSLKVSPKNAQAKLRLAFLLATASDARVRNGPEAVAIAEEICVGPNATEADYVDVLACAYAEAGRFEDAIRTAEHALALAKRGNRPELVRDIGGRLALFRTGRAHHR